MWSVYVPILLIFFKWHFKIVLSQDIFPRNSYSWKQSDTFTHQCPRAELHAGSHRASCILKDKPGCDMHGVTTRLYIVLGTKQGPNRYVLDCIGWWPASSKFPATTWWTMFFPPLKQWIWWLRMCSCSAGLEPDRGRSGLHRPSLGQLWLRRDMKGSHTCAAQQMEGESCKWVNPRTKRLWPLFKFGNCRSVGPRPQEAMIVPLAS